MYEITHKGLVSGHYFVLRRDQGRREYFISYSRWFSQCLLWILVASCTKLLLVLVQDRLLVYDQLSLLVLHLLGINYILKILTVVVLVPILGNVLQFFLQDWILKMNGLETTDYEIITKFYDTVLERESNYQEYHYFSKQTEMNLVTDFSNSSKF